MSTGTLPKNNIIVGRSSAFSAKELNFQSQTNIFKLLLIRDFFFGNQPVVHIDAWNLILEKHFLNLDHVFLLAQSPASAMYNKNTGEF
jgi:hypothetical protein